MSLFLTADACLSWRRRRRKKERLATFWFGTFAMLSSATECVVCHENTRRWM